MTAKKNCDTANGIFEKQIGHTLYEVHYHFSDHCAENVNDKIRRVIQNEIANSQ